jgi:LEA14-like dessication related protein
MLRRLLAFSLLLGLAACSSLPLNAVPPSVSVTEVGVASLGLFEQRFDVGLRVTNPNRFDLKIEALDFELEVNGHAFASGLSRVPALIPAASSSLLRVDAIMQSKDLVRQINTLSPDILKGGVPYRVRGRVKMGTPSIWLPFDHAGVYGGGEKPPTAHAT